MPTYDYRCKACDHQFEHFQSMKSKLLRKCPECGELKLERLIGTGAGLIFKGSGFYITDYRDSSYKKDKSSDGAGKKDASSSGDGEKSSSAGGEASGSGDKKGSSGKKSGGSGKESSTS